MLRDLLWCILQPSKVFQTVTGCMCPVLMLIYVRFWRAHSDLFWGVLQLSEVFWTVSRCIQAVQGMLPDLLWGVLQPSEVLQTVGGCHFLTSTSHSHLLTTTPSDLQPHW